MTDIAPATVDWSQFDRDCQSADKPLPLFRQQLKDITNTLQVDFEAGALTDAERKFRNEMVADPPVADVLNVVGAAQHFPARRADGPTAAPRLALPDQ